MWKLLSSNKIAEFFKNWKTNLILLWYRVQEGEVYYMLHWYQVLEPRLYLMYINIHIHFTSKEIQILKFNIALTYWFLTINWKLRHFSIAFVKNEATNYRHFLGFITVIILGSAWSKLGAGTQTKVLSRQ